MGINVRNIILFFGFFGCDRVIWYGKGLKQHEYSRSELKLSDHRPVKAIITAEVGVTQTLKGFQSFFLSDRFERITSHFELSASTDEMPGENGLLPLLSKKFGNIFLFQNYIEVCPCFDT